MWSLGFKIFSQLMLELPGFGLRLAATHKTYPEPDPRCGRLRVCSLKFRLLQLFALSALVSFTMLTWLLKLSRGFFARFVVYRFLLSHEHQPCSSLRAMSLHQLPVWFPNGVEDATAIADV